MFKGTERFRIIRRIGAGGMGVVYEAEDRERGQRVALKTFKNADSDTLYRLKREFRELADLSHANLVALHELVVAEECFFTMELLDGSDFLSYIRKHEGSVHDAPTLRVGQYDEARLRQALPQLAQGLLALHAAGKIHRDIKPSNIFVTTEGRVVLLDFGLVMRTDGAEVESQPGLVVGTVAYMAPEQCRGEARLTPAADWYAVGTLLYEALTGRIPFDGRMMQVLLEKQQHAPAPPRAIVPTVPEDLDDLCVDLLKRAPEDRPSGSAILRRLGVDRLGVDRRGADPSGRLTLSGTRATPFAGRDLELAQLERGLVPIAGHGAATILVRGPSGIGKSTLIQRFLEHARTQHADLVVLQGRCYERETVPYQAMDSLIDNLSRYWLGLSPQEAGSLTPKEAALLPRLFPVLGRVPAIADAPRGKEIVDPQELRTRAFAALREVLQRVGARHPLILVLDDMQWVDANTLVVLSDLMRPPDPPSLFLLLSTRPEGRQAIESLVGRMDTNTDSIDLAPLPESAATALAAELLGAGAGALAAEVAREARGNPFFIGELVSYAQTGDRASLGTVQLEDVIAQRIAQLSESGRKILQLVALAGEPIPRRVLGSAAGIPAAELAKETATLRTLHFVRSAGARAADRVEPFHDRVRDATLALLAEEPRRAHFRALALGSEQWGEASAQQLARYWHGAGETERAAQHARTAADEARSRLDFDRAAGLYRMALDGGSQEPAARRQLFTLLADTLANAGRPLEAAQSFARAAEGGDAATRIELQRRSADELLRGGYLDEGLAALRTVLAELGLRLAKTPFRAMISGLLLRAWLRLRGLRWRRRDTSDIRPRDLVRLDVTASVASGLAMVDSMRGFEYQARQLLYALRVAEPVRLGVALALEGVYLAAVGNPARAQRMILKARGIAELTQSPVVASYAHAASGMASYFTGGWRNALDEVTEAERLILDRTGAGWEVDTCQYYQCLSLLYLGELGELARRVPGYVREAERRGDRYASVTLRTRFSVIWLCGDDVAAASADLEPAIASWLPDAHAFLLQHYLALHGRAEIALYAGRPEQAAHAVQASWPALERSLLLRVSIVRIEVAHLRGRIALAHAAAAKPARLREAAELAGKLAREREPFAHSFARLLQAGIAHAEGNQPEAVAQLRHALRDLESTETMLHATAARRRLGETLGGDEGAALIAQADAWYAAQGVKDPARMTALLVPGW